LCVIWDFLETDYPVFFLHMPSRKYIKMDVSTVVIKVISIIKIGLPRRWLGGSTFPTITGEVDVGNGRHLPLAGTVRVRYDVDESERNTWSLHLTAAQHATCRS